MIVKILCGSSVYTFRFFILSKNEEEIDDEAGKREYKKEDGDVRAETTTTTTPHDFFIDIEVTVFPELTSVPCTVHRCWKYVSPNLIYLI